MNSLSMHYESDSQMPNLIFEYKKIIDVSSRPGFPRTFRAPSANKDINVAIPCKRREREKALIFESDRNKYVKRDELNSNLKSVLRPRTFRILLCTHTKSKIQNETVDRRKIVEFFVLFQHRKRVLIMKPEIQLTRPSLCGRSSSFIVRF